MKKVQIPAHKIPRETLIKMVLDVRKNKPRELQKASGK